MIKHTTATLDIAKVAEYFTLARDSELGHAEQLKESRINSIRDNEERIEIRERDIAEYRECIEHYKQEVAEIERTIAGMPVPVPVTAEVAQADLARALALPFVKSIATITENDRTYLVVQTRENVLQTTLNRKFSRKEKWYASKPYKIPLPVYNIRIGLRPTRTLANDNEGLVIALADINDTAHFLPWINRYGHQVNPHWGTSNVSSNNYLAYRCVCLGEFEGEITQAFRKSIADGLLALAIYLQSAGTPQAHVHKREWWALWMGKQEYNLAIVPSEKEVETLKEVEETNERDCGCLEDEEGDPLCDDDCDCDCHS